MFFPDKPRYEATQKTTKYTGINYAGYKQGASSAWAILRTLTSTSVIPACLFRWPL